MEKINSNNITETYTLNRSVKIILITKFLIALTQKDQSFNFASINFFFNKITSILFFCWLNCLYFLILSPIINIIIYYITQIHYRGYLKRITMNAPWPFYIQAIYLRSQFLCHKNYLVGLISIRFRNHFYLSHQIYFFRFSAILGGLMGIEPNKLHLKKLMEELLRKFETTSKLRHERILATF